MVLTHIDNDHINGARSILQDYIEGNICDILEIWINDYFRICNLKIDNNDEGNLESLELLRRIIKQKYPIDHQEYSDNNVGYKEANILTEYLSNIKVKDKINSKFGGEPIYIEDKDNLKNITINEEIEITLIGPRKKILIDLIEELE